MCLIFTSVLRICLSGFHVCDVMQAGNIPTNRGHLEYCYYSSFFISSPEAAAKMKENSFLKE